MRREHLVPKEPPHVFLEQAWFELVFEQLLACVEKVEVDDVRRLVWPSLSKGLHRLRQDRSWPRRVVQPQLDRDGIAVGRVQRLGRLPGCLFAGDDPVIDELCPDQPRRRMNPRKKYLE